jgi:microcystin-dependent protein
MPRAIAASLAICAFALLASPLRAAVTSTEGGGQPIANMQASTVLNYIIRTSGDSTQLGEVVPFAGNIIPGGWALADGSILSNSANMDLFHAVGNAYGGDGTHFALPDLRGRTIVGTGTGSGLTPRAIGQKFGTESETLTIANMPLDTMEIIRNGVDYGKTSAVGSASPVPYNNLQPSLVLNSVIQTTGSIVLSSTTVSGPFLGEVRTFAGSMAPAGYFPTDGRSISSSSNQNLGSQLALIYGGTGQSFNLPDLRGRVPIGAAQSPGDTTGAEAITLQSWPAHAHTDSFDDIIVSNKLGPIDLTNQNPSLDFNYIINVNGQFPSSGVDTGTGFFLGELVVDASIRTPSGWLPAQGQILSIANYPALFSLIGTTYGGDGTTTFALPNVMDSAIVGAGAGPGLTPRALGATFGDNYTNLTIDQVPAHSHTLASLPGDYNNNGVVDAADYVLWREHLGESITLPNDDSSGVAMNDYNIWRSEFGTTLATGAGATNVPEPSMAAFVSLLLGIVCVSTRFWHFASREL